jgi:hypothetical protein
VLQDTPIGDPHVITNIFLLMRKTDLEDRFARVQHFLEYLLVEESREREAIEHMSESVPLRKNPGKMLRDDFDRDRTLIDSRINAKRHLPPSGVKTPYVTETSDS